MELKGLIGPYAGAIQEGATGDPTQTIALAPVPAHRRRVVTNVCAEDTLNNVTRIAILLSDGIGNRILKADLNVAALEGCEWTGEVLLEEGHYISAVISGATLGDLLVLDAVGVDYGA